MGRALEAQKEELVVGTVTTVIVVDMVEFTVVVEVDETKVVGEAKLLR